MGKWWLPLLMLLCVAGCPSGGKQPASAPSTASGGAAPPQARNAQQPVAICADPALKVPLEALAADFKTLYPAGYTIRYLERGDLLIPLTASPPLLPEPLPDVFVLADAKALEALRNMGAIDELTSRTFAGDRLVVVKRSGEEWKSATLFDVHRLRFKLLAQGSDHTALGYYTRQALIAEGCEQRLEDRIQRYPKTPEVLQSLCDGKTDLAIAFASNVAQAEGVETMLLVGSDMYEEIRYLAVAGTNSAAAPGVQELLRFLAEDPAVQQKWQGYGLLDRSTAMQVIR